ncbi:MAG: F0F1 ATP synthase subunit epsilon [Acidimicrobiales bacterium]
MALQVELVSPERILFSGEADMVLARTTDGDIAFLTGHTPLIGTLAVGAVTIRLTDGSQTHAAVHGGFVEVSHDRVTLLSDLAELADQIDEARAQAAQDRAGRREAELEDAETEAGLRRAHARLEAVRRAR